MGKVYRACSHKMSVNCMDEYAMVSTELTHNQIDDLYDGVKKIQDILPPEKFSATFREGAKNHMPMCPACQGYIYGVFKLNSHESYEDGE